MKKNQTMNPIFQGALRGIGVLTIVGIGILGLNYTAPTNTHGTSETNETAPTDTIDQEKITMQTDIATLQQHIEETKADTSQTEALLQLQQELATLTEQLKITQEHIIDLIPLGSIIATNGTVSQTEMNNRGWALCDGSDINTQVPNATLKGTTLNLAGRTLIGEGTYAPDNAITFQLGHVDEYKIGDLTFSGEIQHQLTFAEMPYHTHSINTRTHQGGTSTTIATPVDRYGSKSSSTNIETFPAGGDQPHNNMTPFHVVQYYIKVLP